MTPLVDIILPADQLEGTSAKLAQWLFKTGDTVKQGEPIAEVETDKVVMEICAPSQGVLYETWVETGDVIETDVVLGRIDPTLKPSTLQDKSNTSISDPDENAKDCTSPAVRRLLKQNTLSIEQIAGSGRRGRVTRDDVRAFIANPDKKDTTSNPASIATHPNSRRVPHSNMRRTIANHMVKSLLHTSPHVTSVFEMNLNHIIQHRKWHKKDYAEIGINLTFTAYFLAAMVKAVQAVPEANARFHEDALEIFESINIGVGTALADAGLVVPVIEQVQSLTLLEIAKALNVQTQKARQGQITPADLKNGTITISNHGVSGSLFAAPIIINQPEVAILGIGKMEKRVVVETLNEVDNIVIKPMCYVSLTIDHRALDAHQTNLFLSHFVETIEHWGE